MRLSHLLTWLISDLSVERRWGIRRLRRRFGPAIDGRMTSAAFRRLVSQQRAVVLDLADDDDWPIVIEMNAIVFVNGVLFGAQKSSGVDLMHSDETPADDVLAMVAACLQLAGAMPQPTASASPGGAA